MRHGIDRLTRLPQWAWLLLLSAVAILLRVGWTLAIAGGRSPQFDELAYLNHAARLCAGAGYVNDAGLADNFWPAGFPFALAALSCVADDPYRASIGLQIVIGALTCVAISLLGERLFGAAVGRLAGLSLAVYPTHVFYATLALTEPLSTLLLVTAGAILLWNSRSGAIAAVMAGALLGLVSLTRPTFLALPVVLPLWHMMNGVHVRRAIGLGALCVCGAICVLSPWLARNYRELGTWTEVSSTGGYNFLLGNGPTALGGYRGEPNIADLLSENGRLDGSRGYQIGLDAIRQDPLAAIQRLPQKLSYFFALETDGVLWNLKGVPTPTPLVITLLLLAVANVAYLLVSSGCLLALTARSRDPDRPFRALFILLSGYLVLMALVFVGDPRYHYALIPFAALLFAKALLVDAPDLRARLLAGDATAWRQMKRWMALNAVLLALVLVNLWLKYQEVQQFGPDRAG